MPCKALPPRNACEIITMITFAPLEILPLCLWTFRRGKKTYYLNFIDFFSKRERYIFPEALVLIVNAFRTVMAIITSQCIYFSLSVGVKHRCS